MKLVDAKYEREVGLPCKHGFPSESPWDSFANYLRPRELFLWFREIERDLPNGRVCVKGSGEMVMLGGYSYLGLNNHPDINLASRNALARYGTGTNGSRWLAGHTSLHHELENRIAKIHNTEDAVVFSSGFMANVATLSSLLSRKDVVFSDKHNHASLIDGCRYSGAKIIRFRHNDMVDLSRKMEAHNGSGRRLVVVDGVYSMSGLASDLPQIVKLCEKYNAALMVDECHSHFVLGENGKGVKEYFGLQSGDVTIEMGSLSKAIPADGGYIASSADICTFLRRAARGFIYSGATSPVMIAAAIAALDVFEQEKETLLFELSRKTELFRSQLRSLGFDIGDSPTPIVPIKVGASVTAAKAALYCHEHKVFIHPVFPPVVKQGDALLRASIAANHTDEDLISAAKTIHSAVLRAKERTTKEELLMG